MLNLWGRLQGSTAVLGLKVRKNHLGKGGFSRTHITLVRPKEHADFMHLTDQLDLHMKERKGSFRILMPTFFLVPDWACRCRGEDMLMRLVSECVLFLPFKPDLFAGSR